jgi:Protein of unknown function (DUF3443)
MRHLLLATLVSTTMFVSAPIPAGAHPTQTPVAAVAVPVTIQGGQGTTTGARPMVEVRVGNSKPVPVLLDTGSTGLQIYAPVVKTGPGGGVTVTSKRDAITYAGGHRFVGVVARAVIRIGGQATATKVPFGLVEQASCIPSKPTCDAAGGVSRPMKDGAYGILGIGLNKNRQGLFSPVLGMPGRLGQTWSLHLKGKSGALVLGARMPSGRRVAATVQLLNKGVSGGHLAWADSRVRLCDTVGAIGACVPGLFDSGTFTVQLWGSPLNTAPSIPGTNRVVTGTSVAVSVPGATRPFWSYRAGVTKSKDVLTVERGRSAPFVNYGVQAFYDFTITYDEAHGKLILATAT